MGTRSQTSIRPGGPAYNSEPGVARKVTAARVADPGGVAAGIIAGAQAAAQTGVVAGACEHIDVGTVTYGDVQALLATSAGQAALVDTAVAGVRQDEFGAAKVDETVLV